MQPDDDFFHLSWFCFVHICWKKLASCAFNNRANLLVVAKYRNVHEPVSKHLTCQVQSVCQLSHLKSKEPTKFTRLSQTTDYSGEKKRTPLFISSEQNFIFFYKFIYLFLAALGLPCCTLAFPRCVEWGLLFVAMHGLQVRGLHQLCRLSCFPACGIFPDQGSNPCPLHWQADS